MPRSRLAAVAICATALWNGGAFARAVVDLDAPGSLARLHVEAPDRFETVSAMLRDAARLPAADVERYLRTAYRVDDVSFGRLLLASYPAKRRLSFTIGDTGYSATVTVATAAAAMPAD